MRTTQSVTVGRTTDIALNRGKDVRRAMPLIKARTAVDPHQLSDEGVDLRNLVEGRLSGAHI